MSMISPDKKLEAAQPLKGYTLRVNKMLLSGDKKLAALMRELRANSSKPRILANARFLTLLIAATGEASKLTTNNRRTTIENGIFHWMFLKMR